MWLNICWKSQNQLLDILKLTSNNGSNVPIPKHQDMQSFLCVRVEGGTGKVTTHGTIDKDPSRIWDSGLLILVCCTEHPSWYLILYCLFSVPQRKVLVPVSNERKMIRNNIKKNRGDPLQLHLYYIHVFHPMKKYHQNLPVYIPSPSASIQMVSVRS